jgi:hypothetical protein
VPLPFLARQCDQNEKNSQISKQKKPKLLEEPQIPKYLRPTNNFFAQIHFKVKIKFGLNWSWTTLNREKMFLVYATNLLEAINVKNDTQHNDTQHNDTQHNDTQHNGTHHNGTHHNGSVMTLVVL